MGSNRAERARARLVRLGPRLAVIGAAAALSLGLAGCASSHRGAAPAPGKGVGRTVTTVAGPVPSTTVVVSAGSIPPAAVQVAASIVRSQHLDAAAAACVRVRLSRDGSLVSAGGSVLADVGAGCRRAADLVAPTFVGSLASRHLTASQAACVTEGLYAMSSAQMDAMTSAMLAPKGKGAAAARAVVSDVLKGCGV